MSKRFVALIIFKEGQAWAVRSLRELAARARAFLGLPAEQPPKPEDRGPP